MSDRVKIYPIDGKFINLYDIIMYEVEGNSLVISFVNREAIVFNAPADIDDAQVALEELHAAMMELETVAPTEVKVIEPVTIMGAVSIVGPVETKPYVEPVEEPEEPVEEPPEEEPTEGEETPEEPVEP